MLKHHFPQNDNGTLNRQLFFDEAARHVLAQGQACVDAIGNCVYFGPEGRRCAVGFFLDDETQVLEVGAADELPDIENLFGNEDVGLMMAVQTAHDLCADKTLAFNNSFKTEMRDVARRYMLNADVVQ